MKEGLNTSDLLVVRLGATRTHQPKYQGGREAGVAIMPISVLWLLVLVMACLHLHVHAFHINYYRGSIQRKHSLLKGGSGDDESSRSDFSTRGNNEIDRETFDGIIREEDNNYDLDLLIEDKTDVVQVREEDLQQYRDLGIPSCLFNPCLNYSFTSLLLDLILTERAKRFYDPKLVGIEKEKCILVAVGIHPLIY